MKTNMIYLIRCDIKRERSKIILEFGLTNCKDELPLTGIGKSRSGGERLRFCI